MFQKLGANGQKLVTSIAIFNLVSPIIGTFVTAFIWRSNADITLVALYVLVSWSTTPIGFYLNGRLMRKFPVGKLFLFGTIMQGFVVSVLLFLQPIGPVAITAFALLSGLFSGFYWSNRDFLTLTSINSDKRVYFGSLENATGTVASITIPPIVGFFIVFGDQAGLYTIRVAYVILGIITLLTLFLAGKRTENINLETPGPAKVTLQKATKNWGTVRKLMFFVGTFNGLEMFLPSILVLTLVGNEGTLGTIQSITALFSAAVIYLLGRKTSHNLFRILLIGTVLTTIGSLILGLAFTAVGVVTFLAFNSLGFSLRWLAILPAFYDSIHLDPNHGNNHQYAYIFDNEVVLNTGRFVGVGSFLLAFWLFGESVTRFIIPVFAITQLGTLYLGRSVIKKTKSLQEAPD